MVKSLWIVDVDVYDLFDDGSSPFDDVAFNGLVDGAGEFPLWEKDSHK